MSIKCSWFISIKCAYNCIYYFEVLTISNFVCNWKSSNIRCKTNFSRICTITCTCKFWSSAFIINKTASINVIITICLTCRIWNIFTSTYLTISNSICDALNFSCFINFCCTIFWNIWSCCRITIPTCTSR